MTSSPPAPAVDLDLSAFVAGRLDRHLRDLQDLRDQMRARTTTVPGARLALTYAAVRLAEQFAAEVSGVVCPDGQR